MPQYTAVFIAIEGLSETDIGVHYRLAATQRDEAADEALLLPRPEGSNFIKLIREGQYESPKIGFDL